MTDKKIDERLIECVRANECLYNSSCREYKDGTAKKAAWSQMAKELGLPAPELKKMWNMLRNAYLHAMSRRKAATREQIKNFKKWKYEDEMSFLLPYLGQRPASNYHVEVETMYEDNSIDDADDSNHETDSSDNKKHSIDDFLDTVKETRHREEKGDIDLFFESMAKTVKSLPKIEQIKLKFQIMQLINDAEMKCFSGQGHSSELSDPLSTVSVRKLDKHY